MNAEMMHEGAAPAAAPGPIQPQAGGRSRARKRQGAARKTRRRRSGTAAAASAKRRLPSGRRMRRAAGRHGSGRRRGVGRRMPVTHPDGAAASFPDAVPGDGHREATGLTSVEEAFERGRYEGGERLLEQMAPPGYSLADLTLPEVIAHGMEALRHRLVPVMDAGAVCAELEAAMAESRPISVVRLGDGELLALAQDTVYEAAYIRREAPFLPRAGVEVPDHEARERLADAVRRATIVGVPMSRWRHFGPLAAPALAGNGIDIRTLRLTESTVNYSLYLTGHLHRLLQGRRLLVIGNAAHGLAAKLAEAGFAVTGAISPVRGFADIDRVAAEAAAIAGSFDLALVAAGVPAVIIAARLASELGKAAIDFGHLADHIAGGQVKLI